MKWYIKANVILFVAEIFECKIFDLLKQYNCFFLLMYLSNIMTAAAAVC